MKVARSADEDDGKGCGEGRKGRCVDERGGVRDKFGGEQEVATRVGSCVSRGGVTGDEGWSDESNDQKWV